MSCERTDIASTPPPHNARRCVLNRLIQAEMAARSCILEIGCATGATAYATRWTRYVGLDHNLQSLESFSANNTTNGSTPALIQSDATALPFADHTFDGVYSLGTLDLLEPDQLLTVLSECRRVGTSNASYVFSLRNTWSAEQLVYGRQHWSGDPRYTYHTHSYRQARTLFIENGFAIVGQRHMHALPYQMTNTGIRAVTWLDERLARWWPQVAAHYTFICRKTNACASLGERPTTRDHEVRPEEMLV